MEDYVIRMCVWLGKIKQITPTQEEEIDYCATTQCQAE